MAWLFSTQPLPRWTVGTETAPSFLELGNIMETYRITNREKFRFGSGLREQGVHLPRELFPTQARLISSTRNPPDFVTIDGGGVSERVKDIIETFEPGVHQFVEVPVYLRDGTPAPTRYFAVSYGRVATGQIYDPGTTMRRNLSGKIMPPTEGADHDKIMIDRTYTAGWHLWVSRDIYDMRTMSDDLHREFMRQRIPGLEYTHLTERGDF